MQPLGRSTQGTGTATKTNYTMDRHIKPWINYHLTIIAPKPARRRHVDNHRFQVINSINSAINIKQYPPPITYYPPPSPLKPVAIPSTQNQQNITSPHPPCKFQKPKHRSKIRYYVAILQIFDSQAFPPIPAMENKEPAAQESIVSFYRIRYRGRDVRQPRRRGSFAGTSSRCHASQSCVLSAQCMGLIEA